MGSGEDLGTLRGKIVLDDHMSAGADSATRTLNNLKSTVAGVALGMVGAGGLAAAVTTVMYGVKQLVENAIEFEDSMARVQARTGMTSEELQQQSNEVIKLAVAYGRDAGGLAKALDLVYEGGVKTSEAIDFLNVAVKGAKIGNMEYGQSIDMISVLLGSFRLETSKAGEVLDILTKASNKSDISLAALGQGMRMVAPIASEAGMSLNQTVAAITTMTKQGVPAEQAIMGLKGLLAEMIHPTKELAKAFGGESIEAVGGFGNALNNLMRYTGGNAVEIGKLIPSIRMMPGIMKLAANGGQEFADSQKEVEKSAGEADRQIKTLIETKKTLWARAWEAVKHPIEAINLATENKVLDAQVKKNKSIEDYNILIDAQLKLQEGMSEKSLPEVLINQQIAASEKYIKQLEKEKQVLVDKEKVEAAARKESLAAAARPGELQAHPLTPGGKTQSQIDREKEESDKKEKLRAAAKKQADQEEMQRKIKMADLEMQTDTAIHEVRVRSYQEQIELWEKEADRADKTETEKLGYSMKALEKRKELAQIEYAFAIDHLKDLHDKEIIEAKGKKDVIDQIEKWYIAASKNIDSEFATRTEKIQKLTTEVAVKLDDSAMTKLSKEVSFNFRKWADDLKNGSVAAWRGLISDTRDSINAIADLFGGLPGKVAGTVDDMANVFDSILSGNPLKVMTSILTLGKNISSYFGDSKYKEQMDQNREDFYNASVEAMARTAEAAANAREAAVYFLKMQGKADLSLMSMSELRGMEGEAQATITGMTGTVDSRWSKADLDRIYAAAGSPLDDSFKGGAAAGEIGKMLAERGIGPGSQQAMQMTHSMLTYLSTQYNNRAILKPITTKLAGIQQEESFRTEVKEGYSPDESKATTWENAKTIIEQKHSEGTYSDALYASKLQEYAHKFWETVSPAEMMSINAMGSGGVATPVAGTAQIEENAAADTLSSLWRYKPRSFLGALSGASASTGSGNGARDINVSILVDPNIPINADGATQLGNVVADQIAVQTRAGG